MFTAIWLAFALLVASGVLVWRRQRGRERGNAIRYALLAVALFFIAFGSTTASASVADDPGNQCGGSAVSAAAEPASVTPNTNGETCRVLGRRALRTAYICLGVGALLSVGVALGTRTFVADEAQTG